MITPFWIEAFSEVDGWRGSASPAEIEQVMLRFPDAAVEALAQILPEEPPAEHPEALPHLLRQWALSIFRFEQIAAGLPLPKEARTQVKALGRTLVALQGQLRSLDHDAVHYLSIGMEAELPGRTTVQTLVELYEAADRLEAAATRITSRPGRNGRPPITLLVERVRGLAEIYAHVTGERPSRTYDPDSDTEVSTFTRFTEAVFAALHPDKAISLDHAIRKALSRLRDGENPYPI